MSTSEGGGASATLPVEILLIRILSCLDKTFQYINKPIVHGPYTFSNLAKKVIKVPYLTFFSAP